MLFATAVAYAEPAAPDRMVHFAGLVQVKPDPVVGNWQIDGRTVIVTAQTRLLPNAAAIQQGDIVIVDARMRDNVLAAHTIVKPQAPSQSPITGRIVALAAGKWTIGDYEVLIDSETRIEGDPPDVGDTAMAWVERTGAGLLAKRILVKDPPPAPPRWLITGKIEALAADKWTIGAQEVLIDGETRIDGDHPDMGDTAMAWVERTGAGLLAKRILVKDPPPPPPGPRFVVFRGVVTAIDNAGVYTVQTGDGEKQVKTDDQTRIVGSPVANDRVLVKGQMQDDGTVLALMIVKLGDNDQQEQTPFAGFVSDVMSSTLLTAATDASVKWVWGVELPAHDGEEARTWTVVVDADTNINVDPNTVEVGAFIKGAGIKLDDASIQASMVRVTRPPQVRFEGEITARPAADAPDFPLGLWTIGGKSVIVTAETRVVGETPAVGRQAAGHGVLQADGGIAARLLMIR